MRARGARERRLGWGVEVLRPSLFETLREASLLHSAFVRVRGRACVCVFYVCVCVSVCMYACSHVVGAYVPKWNFGEFVCSGRLF